MNISFLLALIGCAASFDIFDESNFVNWDDADFSDFPEEDSEVGMKFLVEHPSTPFGDMLGLEVQEDGIHNIAQETEGFDASFKGMETPFWKLLEQEKSKRDASAPKCGCANMKQRRRRQVVKRTGTHIEAGNNGTWDRWPNNTVIYHLKSGGPEVNSAKIASALGKFSDKLNGCIKFKELKVEPDRSSDLDYVQIVNGGNGVCNSYIGRIGYNQSMSLGAGCETDVVIQHEFMHALGFIHEHNRADRSTTVRVNFKNIDSDQCRNFEKCANCRYFAKYNTKSIMQYPSYGFNCNGGNTVVKLDGSEIYYNHDIQDSDIVAIKAVYSCK